LNNIPKIEIRLAMTDKVNFFAAQFYFILGASIANQKQLLPMPALRISN